MPTIRFTAFFRDDDGNGWSETHDADGGSTITSLAARLASFNSLMKTFRVPLLCGDTFYIGARASYKTPDRTIAGDNILLDPPQRGPQTVAGEAVGSDAIEVAVKMRLRNEAATARTDVYLRGMPTQVVSAGVLDFIDAVGSQWKIRADSYANQLITQAYGWVGINPAATSRGVVTGYTSNPDQTVTLNCTQTNGIPIPAAGTKLQIKFARINGSKSILNRVLVCTVDAGAASFTTIEKIATSPFQTDGTYIAMVTGFVPYAVQSYYKLARRKTGRPFGLQRGRLPTRTLH